MTNTLAQTESRTHATQMLPAKETRITVIATTTGKVAKESRKTKRKRKREWERKPKWLKRSRKNLVLRLILRRINNKSLTTTTKTPRTTKGCRCTCCCFYSCCFCR